MWAVTESDRGTSLVKQIIDACKDCSSLLTQAASKGWGGNYSLQKGSFDDGYAHENSLDSLDLLSLIYHITMALDARTQPIMC